MQMMIKRAYRVNVIAIKNRLRQYDWFLKRCLAFVQDHPFLQQKYKSAKICGRVLVIRSAL